MGEVRHRKKFGKVDEDQTQHFTDFFIQTYTILTRRKKLITYDPTYHRRLC